MKKLFCALLALCLTLALLTGCGKAPVTETRPAASTEAAPVETAPTAIETAPALPPAPEPLALLEKVWASYDEEERFSAMGGDMEAQIMGAPGQYDLKFAENLQYMLLVPQERLEDIEQVATLIHMMNANSFTCGVFKLKPEADRDAFVQAMQESILGNQWMCGFPDLLRIAVFGEDTLLVAYGVEELMNRFGEKLSTAWGQEMTVAVDQPIG